MKKTMKKALALVLALGLLVLCCACGSSDTNTPTNDTSKPAEGSTGSESSGLTEKITLTFSHHDAANSTTGLYWQQWADDIYEASNGMIEITVYPTASLAAPADGLTALQTGVCDILWTATGFFPGQFNITESITMPFLGITSSVQGTKALNEAYETMPEMQEEWSSKGLKPIILNTTEPAYLLSTKQIASPSDVGGLSIRGMAGLPLELIANIGASAVVTPSGDIFTSMDKGILHGTLFNLSGARGFSLYEVADYVMDYPFYVNCLPVVMLQSTWDALPDEAKAIMEQFCGLNGALPYAEALDADGVDYYNMFNEKGGITTLTDDQRAEWDAAAKETADKWLADNSTDSFDYASYYNQVKEIVAKYAE